MKTYVKAGLAFGLLVPGLAFAGQHNNSWSLVSSLKPYVGVNGTYRENEYRDNFGSRIFRQGQPNIDGYLGLRFHENLGLEGGYEVTLNNRKSSQLGMDTSELGQFPANNIRVKARSKVHGWHLGVIGEYQLVDKGRWYGPIQVFGKVGFKAAEGYHTRVRFDKDTTTNVFQGKESVTTGKKYFAKLTAGVQYFLINEYVSIRGLVSWENSSRLKASFNERDANGASNSRILTIKHKNATSYGAGLAIYPLGHKV